MSSETTPTGKPMSIWLNKDQVSDYTTRAARQGIELRKYVANAVSNAGANEDADATAAEELNLVKSLLVKVLTDQQAQNAALKAHIETLESRSMLLSETVKSLILLTKTQLGDVGFIRQIVAHQAEPALLAAALQEEQIRHKRVGSLLAGLDDIERELAGEAGA